MSEERARRRGDIRSLLHFMGGLLLIFAGGAEIVSNPHIGVAVAFGLLLCLGGVGLLITEYGIKANVYFRYVIYAVVFFCVLLWIASWK